MKKDFGVKTWLYPMPVLMIALALCGCKSSFLAPRTGEYFQTTRMGPGNSVCAYGLPLIAGAGCLMSGTPLAILGVPLCVVGVPVAGVGFVADVCMVSPLVDLLCLPYDLCQPNHGFFIRIVDEEGCPVSDVTVKGTLNHGFHMDADIGGITDEVGEIYVNRLSFENFKIKSWSEDRAGWWDSRFKRSDALKLAQDGRYVFQFTLDKANPGGWKAKTDGTYEELLAFLPGKWSADAESRKWLQHGFACPVANDLSKHWLELRPSGSVDLCAPEWYRHYSGNSEMEVKSHSWKLERKEPDMEFDHPEFWRWRVRIHCADAGKYPIESDYLLGEDELGVYLSPGPFKTLGVDYDGKAVLKFRKVRD